MTTPISAGANFTVDAAPVGFSEADLLALLDRLFPEWYLAPLKDPGPGYEWYQAMAAMCSRASLAIARTEAGLFVAYASGGARAEADVLFTRDTTASGAFTVRAGTIVRTSKTNRSFELVEDVAFGTGDLSASGRVRAVAPAYEYNVAGPVTTADGTVLPGEIDTVVIPILDPVLAETSLQVSQLDDATGGVTNTLDQLGLDRDLPRNAGEPDEVYKGRVRQLPDTVSPAALRRQLDAVFLPLGLTYQLIETWQNEYQTCWDFPDGGDLVHPELGIARADCFAFDDPRVDPFRGRWMDEHDFVAGLLLVVPEVGAWSQRAFAYDDQADLTQAGGTLGPSSTAALLNTVDLVDSVTGAQSPVLTNSSVWAAVFESKFIGDGGNGHRAAGIPFTGFDAGLGIVFTFVAGTPHIEVRDQQFFDAGTSTWLNDDNAVGVLVRSNTTVLVSDIEAAVTATSTLVTVEVADGTPGKFVSAAFVAAAGTLIGALSGGIASNETARGWRARSAYDAPDRDGDPAQGSFVRVPFFDGTDALHDQFYLNVSDLLLKIKGGGTNSAIELEGQ